MIGAKSITLVVRINLFKLVDVVAEFKHVSNIQIMTSSENICGIVRVYELIIHRYLQLGKLENAIKQ